ncbi:MAG: hypothetical protein QG672_1934 [Pseudomonadota bacterium]|nr:hypothetical protein [Pseudomonadota bacterium]
MQSRDAEQIDYALADTCWPVHQAIIDIVRPRLILAYGNSDMSPYRYLQKMFAGVEDDVASLPAARHGNWRVRGFVATISGQETYVAGLPHMSRYDPRGNVEIVSWLRSKLGT